MAKYARQTGPFAVYSIGGYKRSGTTFRRLEASGIPTMSDAIIFVGALEVIDSASDRPEILGFEILDTGKLEFS